MIPPNKLRALRNRLTLLQHVAHCTGAAACDPRCARGRRLCEHMRTCTKTSCSFRRCVTSRRIRDHVRACANPRCKLCRMARVMAKE